MLENASQPITDPTRLSEALLSSNSMSESFKKAGALTIEQTINTLLVPEGFSSWQDPYTGAIIFDRDGHTVILPARHWRKNIVFDPRNDGEIMSAELRGPNDTRVMSSEISYLNLCEDNIESASVLAHDYLSTALGEHSGSLLKGPEFEFTVHGINALDTLPEDIIELSILQREKNHEYTQLPALNGNFGQELNMHVTNSILAEAEAHNTLINFASSHPVTTNLSQAGISPHPYIKPTVNALVETVIKPNLSLVPQETIYAWDQAAKALNYDNPEQMIWDNPDMRYWIANCLHVSIDMPVYADTSESSEVIFRNVTNLYTYFRELINGTCYSGGTTFGTEIKLAPERNGDPEQVTADSRELLRMLMPTSMPAEIIPANLSVKSRMKEAMLSGQSSTVDRTAVPIRLHDRNTGKVVELSSLHGDTRWRVSTSFKDFWKTDAKVKAGEQDAFADENSGLGASARIEYTSRPSTPDLRKYWESVALQELLTLAGLLSVADGEADVFTWLEKNMVDSFSDTRQLSQSMAGETFSERQFDLAVDSLRGNFSEDKLSKAYQLVDLVEARTNALGYRVNAKTFELARRGLGALSHGYRSQDVVTNVPGSPEQRLEDYLAGSITYKNYGEFVNSLSGNDLAAVCTYCAETDAKLGEIMATNNMNLYNRGDAVMLLNHYVLKQTAALIAQPSYN